jgi:hypothetical protein
LGPFVSFEKKMSVAIVFLQKNLKFGKLKINYNNFTINYGKNALNLIYIGEVYHKNALRLA